MSYPVTIATLPSSVKFSKVGVKRDRTESSNFFHLISERTRGRKQAKKRTWTSFLVVVRA